MERGSSITWIVTAGQPLQPAFLQNLDMEPEVAACLLLWAWGAGRLAAAAWGQVGPSRAGEAGKLGPVRNTTWQQNLQ